MKTKQEEKLHVLLLKEKLEKLSGKKVLFSENVKMTKQSYLNKGLISEEDLEKLKELDNTPTFKNVYWFATALVKEKVEMSHLQNVVTEYYALKGKTKTAAEKVDAEEEYKELHREAIKEPLEFSSFSELEDFVNEANSILSDDLQGRDDYDVLWEDSQLFIVRPNTWEASNEVGRKWFNDHPTKGASSSVGCAWCTTYNTNSHFNAYFLGRGVDFYYIKTKGDLKKKITKITPTFRDVALELQNNKFAGLWDINDNPHFATSSKVKKYIRTINEHIGQPLLSGFDID